MTQNLINEFAQFARGKAKIKNLLDQGVDENEKATVLIAASHHGHLALVKKTLELGVDDQDLKMKALDVATRQGKSSVVKFLLEQGVYTHPGDNEALIHACDRNFYPVVRLLLENKACNQEGINQALEIAFIKENKKIIRLLLRHGAEFETIDENYLNKARSSGRTVFVDWFLKQKK